MCMESLTRVLFVFSLISVSDTPSHLSDSHASRHVDTRHVYTRRTKTPA